jgi:hypothetical protein
MAIIASIKMTPKQAGSLYFRAERMQAELIRIRDLLAAQEDKACLGTGYPKSENDCAPWAIVDEVVYSITKVLSDK